MNCRLHSMWLFYHHSRPSIESPSLLPLMWPVSKPQPAHNPHIWRKLFHWREEIKILELITMCLIVHLWLDFGFRLNSLWFRVWTGQSNPSTRLCHAGTLLQIQDLDMSTIHKTQAQVQVVVERGFSARDGGIIFKLNEQHLFAVLIYY